MNFVKDLVAVDHEVEVNGRQGQRPDRQQKAQETRQSA